MLLGPGAAFTTEQFYDAFSRPYQIKYPARVGIAGDPRRTVTYLFGADGRPRQVLVDSNSRQPGPVSGPRRPQGILFADGITYEPGGNLQNIVFVQGPLGAAKVEELYTYHDNGARRSQAIAMNGQTIVQSQYGYYTSGQLPSIQDADAAYIRSFRYDALARLARVSGASLATRGRWDISYGYDNYGNRTAVTAAGVLPGGISIPPDGSTQLAVAPSGRITSEGFAYNAAGEITRRRGSDNAEQWLDYDQDGPPCQGRPVPPRVHHPPLCPGGTSGYHGNVFLCSRPPATYR